MRSTRQQSEARWGSLRQTILLLSHELLVIIDRRPRSDLLFCAQHLFVTAIVTGPRQRRTGSRMELSLKGHPQTRVTTSWIAPGRLLPIRTRLCFAVNPYGTLHFPMLRGLERVLNKYMYEREDT
jgi:hypothetical protein